MAYSRANLIPLNSEARGNLWMYISDDNEDVFGAAGYFGDMVTDGILKEDDIMIIVDHDGATIHFAKFANPTNASTVETTNLVVTTADVTP